MGKTSKRQLQLRFLFLVVIFIGSLIFLIFELIPIQVNYQSLPSPDKIGHLPLSSAIYKSKQAQDLRNHTVEIKDISQLFWALQGITHGSGHRTVPSAGATYPLEIFVIHKGSPTLKKGCYNYIPYRHQLKFISSSFNSTLLLSSLFGKDREAVSNVSTVFFILAEYSRTTNLYNSPHSLYSFRGVQYVHLEVGHAIQNFLLQLTSLNLNTRVIVNFTSIEIQTFLATSLVPMAVLPIGISRNLDPPILSRNKLILENKEELTVEEAVAKRKSVRDYQGGSIPLSVISDLLNDSTTIPHLLENDSYLDVRLVVGEIDGLQHGSYQFFLENNSLYQLSQGDLRPSLREAGSNQIWIETAQLDIVISVDTNWIIQQFDSVFSHRILMYDIGMMAQNIYLKCASLGLGTVVVGAFNEGMTSQVVELPSTHKPIYIMPIGLTSEFFEETRDNQIPLTELARIIGLLSYIPFYICLYLSLPMLRRHMTKKTRWIHCISGVITFLGVIFHFMVIHGHVRNFGDFFIFGSYYDTLIRFIIDILTFPMTRYDIGQYLANLAIILGTSIAMTGIIIAFKISKQRKLMKTTHKYFIFLTIGSLILHALLNGTIFAAKPLVFLFLNILVIDLYFLLSLSPDLVKAIQKEEISYQ